MIAHFLDYIAIERKYSQRTVDAYRDDLRDFCLYLKCAPQDFCPEEVGEDDVKGWMLYMLDEQKQSPRSVKRRLSALRGFGLHPSAKPSRCGFARMREPLRILP